MPMTTAASRSFATGCIWRYMGPVNRCMCPRSMIPCVFVSTSGKHMMCMLGWMLVTPPSVMQLAPVGPAASNHLHHITRPFHR